MAEKHTDAETTENVQADEVADLFGDFGLDTKNETEEEEETDEASAGEETTDDEDSTETEEEEEGSGEEGAEEAETSEAEEEEEGSEDAEDSTGGDDLETLKAQNAQLLAQVNELSGATAAPKPAAKPAEEASPKPEAEIDFLGELDIDDVLDSKENFNKFMNQVYQQARRDAAEQTLLSIPSVVGNQVRMQTSLNKAIKEFYDENPELEQAKPYVGRVADQVASEHPDWTMSQIFAEVAGRAKKGLGLPTKPGKKSASKPTRKPGLPSRSSGGSRPKPAERVSEIEQDIADTFDI